MFRSNVQQKTITIKEKIIPMQTNITTIQLKQQETLVGVRQTKRRGPRRPPVGTQAFTTQWPE